MKQRFNIVVPMAGRGSRFTEQGYTDSKPFIDVNGKPMIQRVIENLNIEFDDQYEFVIICLREDYDKYDFNIFNDIIGHDNWDVICLSDVTEGAPPKIQERKKDTLRGERKSCLHDVLLRLALLGISDYPQVAFHRISP